VSRSHTFSYPHLILCRQHTYRYTKAHVHQQSAVQRPEHPIPVTRVSAIVKHLAARARAWVPSPCRNHNSPACRVGTTTALHASTATRIQVPCAHIWKKSQAAKLSSKLHHASRPPSCLLYNVAHALCCRPHAAGMTSKALPSNARDGMSQASKAKTADRLIMGASLSANPSRGAASLHCTPAMHALLPAQ